MDEGQHTSLNDGPRGGWCITRLTREQPKSVIMYLCKKNLGWGSGLETKISYFYASRTNLSKRLCNQFMRLCNLRSHPLKF